jgi:DNA (cytosine-5)-methyltransferase 1
MIDYLFNKGISQNYNEPMTRQQISRLSEEQLKKIIENILITHNLVNIQKVKAEDLEIVDTDKYDYILTYSFPCQDLSLAGKGKGMSDTSTRSGMLWEVERILTECKEIGTMPQILLMENVPQVHGVDNVKDFNKWQLRLEELGYKSYFQDLIATDYGIPQTRNRCFMISILGDYSYTFPKPIPLKLKLKDMLEDNVDEKYYLSDKMKQYIFSEDDKYKVNKNSLKLNRDIACSKTTREGWTRADTSDYIADEVINTYDEYNHKINGSETIGTIQAMYPVPNHGHRLIIKNATKQGYLEATDGDGIDISSRMEHHRGNVQKDKIQTLTTSGGNDRRVVIETYQYAKSETFMQGKDRLQLGKEVSDTLQTTQKEGIVNSNLRIRKLTPYECFALMGVKREDYDKVKKNQSDSSLYHLAGDSIVVNVLMAIFKESI